MPDNPSASEKERVPFEIYAGLAAVVVAALAATFWLVPSRGSVPPSEVASAAPSASAAREPDLDGRPLYLAKCAGCHGKEGRGDGPAAKYLRPRPRDFTRGLFKFGSTAPGEPPSDADIARVITERVYWSAMHPYGDFEPNEIEALVREVKRLSVMRDPGSGRTVQHFSAGRPPKPLVVLPPPPESPGTLEVGRTLFRDHCASCHGAEGRGKGDVASELKDAWGDPVVPRDLTIPIYKTGATAQHVFLVISRGIPGTPMPSFVNLDGKDRWALAYYVVSLHRWPERLSRQGELLYEAYGCGSCHGEAGKGGIQNPNAIKETVPRLNTMAQTLMLGDEEEAGAFISLLQNGENPLEVKEVPDILRWPVVAAQYRSVLDVIRDGNPSGKKDPSGVTPPLSMPIWGHKLYPADVNALLAYLVTLQSWEEDE